MIAWFAKNGVAANLLMGVIVISGIFSIRGLKMELFPDFDLDLVTISVPYPGAAWKWKRESASRLKKRFGIFRDQGNEFFARENLGVVSIQVALGKTPRFWRTKSRSGRLHQHFSRGG